MGSAHYLAFGWAPWTAPSLEDILPQLSGDEQQRLHAHLRSHERIKQYHLPRHSESERDLTMIRHVRYALHHYNAKHPGAEFDAVKPLMESSAYFRDQSWHHINFWARCRRTSKIKRFFAEVHYRMAPAPVPAGDASVCSHRSPPVPGAAKPPNSCGLFCEHLPVFVPTVEACTIIEEPLGRYWKSCAFCPGRLDILHPKGRGFVCGNDKDRVLQRITHCRSNRGPLEMPFTCHQGPESSNGDD